MNISISLSAVLGAILGYFIFRNGKIGGGWGAAIGFFLLPVLFWVITKPFGINING